MQIELNEKLLIIMVYQDFCQDAIKALTFFLKYLYHDFICYLFDPNYIFNIL